MLKEKMKNNFYLLMGIMFLLAFMPFSSSADQPTQQFNKIFLSPFYVLETENDVATNFSVTVNPPDRIGEVISALISFDIFLNPSVEFTLLVNDQACNNPTYYVSTTYANAGKNMISFDCSNVITQAGTYALSLVATKDTGALTGWLDLTYLNDPSGAVDVLGTEYSPNDPATIFLQLKDNQGYPVLDGACYLDIYSPLVNLTHSKYIDDGAMLMVDDENGVYYYDLLTPSVLGVYMLSASCSYSYEGGYLYALEGDTDFPTRNDTYGTYSGNTFSLNGYIDGLYEECVYGSVLGQKVCEAQYDFDVTNQFDNQTNFTNIDLHYMGEATGDPTSTFYVWNWTDSTWITLPNTLTFTGTATATSPTGVDEYVANPLPLTDTINGSGIIRVRQYVSSAQTFNLYNNWLNVKVLTAEGIVQDIKGSSEMHITNIPQATADLIGNMTLNVNTSLIAESVWTYVDRSLNDFNFTVDIDDEALVEDIWNYVNRNLTYTPDETNYTLIEQLIEQYSTDETNYTLIQQIVEQYSNNLTAYDIWTYVDRQLTYTEDVFNYSALITSEDIWTYVNRSLTQTEDVFNYSALITPEDIWDYVNRTLTDYDHQEQLDLTNYTLIEGYIYLYSNNISAEEIWDFTNRTLTDYDHQDQLDLTNYTFIQELIALYGNDLTAELIWDYSNRNLTYYPEQVDLSNYTLIQEIVEEYSNNLTAEEIWEYQNRTLTDYDHQAQLDLTNYTLIQDLIYLYGNELTSELIWTYANRNLTYYPAQVDLTNYTLVEEIVEKYSNNLTVEEIWGFNGTISTSLLDQISASIWDLFTNTYDFMGSIATSVWEFENRTLSDSEYAKITEYIWTYDNRNLTFYEVNDITPEDVWTYVSRNLTFTEDVTDYDATAEYVWNYVDRNLTSEYINNITVDDIWTYYNRSLTQDIPMQIWSYPERNLTTDLPFDIWSYENRTLTYYTLNLSELIDMINDYEFNDTIFPTGAMADYGGVSGTLNVLFYVEK